MEFESPFFNLGIHYYFAVSYQLVFADVPQHIPFYLDHFQHSYLQYHILLQKYSEWLKTTWFSTDNTFSHNLRDIQIVLIYRKLVCSNQELLQLIRVLDCLSFENVQKN